MKPDQGKPSGAFGWLAIFVIATAYDAYALKTKKIETLSRAFWRWNKHPLGAIVTSGLWAAISFHILIDNPIRNLVKESTDGSN